MIAGMKEQEEKTRKKVAQKGIMMKFIYGILIPLVVILVITGIVLSVQITAEIETLQENSLSKETESAARFIDGYFESYFSMIETIAALPLVQETLDEVSKNGESFRDSPYRDEVVNALVEIQKLSPDAIQSLYIADFTTSQYLRWDGLTPEGEWDITTRPYYSLVNEAKETILTSAFQNVAGSTVVSLSTPVFAPNSTKILGIVNIDLSLDSLIKSMNDISVGNDGYVILFDSTHNIISARDEELLLKNVDEVGFSDELIDEIKNDKTGNVEYQYDGVSYCGNAQYVENLNGWCVLGVMTDTEYHQPINNITIIVVICFVLCIIILAILCIMVVRNIVKPIKELSGVVEELAKGNLNIDCTMSADDEIGHLASGVRMLVARLQTYILYIDETYEILERMGKGNLVFEMKQDYAGEFAKLKIAMLDIQKMLSDILKRITETSVSITDNAEVLSVAAHEVADGTVSQAASIEELSASVNQISDNVEISAKHAKTAENISLESEKLVEIGSQKMTEVKTAMENISESSSRINEIIQKIDDIATQTNLLSLNASIEAARAGEAGRGFAVVANQVQSLAQQSAEAVKDTEYLIQQSVAAVQNGIVMVNDMAESLKDIVDGSERTLTLVREIATASGEQEEAIKQVTIGVEQVAEVVTVTTETAGTTADTSAELTDYAAQLKQLVEKFTIE